MAVAKDEFGALGTEPLDCEHFLRKTGLMPDATKQ
jgi:hypothetical protein